MHRSEEDRESAVLELANDALKRFSAQQDEPLDDREQEMFIHGFEAVFHYGPSRVADSS